MSTNFMSEGSQGSRLIYVYCKLPNGMIFSTPKGGQVKLNGSNTSSIIGGYGETAVPADEWAEVMKVWSKHPAITSNAIFAAEKSENGKEQAKEQAEVKTGLEPVDPKSPGTGVKPNDDPAVKNKGKA